MTFPIPEIALQQHLAILAKTGAGKTTTAKGVVEHVVIEDDARVCILDTIKSDWWGLTSSADGKKPGLPFSILGGPHGHVPLLSTAGAAVGELVGSGALPLSIIDMAEFEPGGIQRFFAAFAPALLSAMRGVLYLVLEEAHEIAPKERAGFGGESMSIHFAKKLATAGRSKGIRLIVVTHRVQSLHNAVLGSCDTLIAQRLTAPADQEPVIKWLKANATKDVVDQVSSSLSSLPTGTGWIVSGEARVFERVKFPMITTFDNSKTPTKDSAAPAAIATAAIDLDKLRSLLAAAAPKPSPGAGKAGGPGVEAKAPAPTADAIAAAEQRGYDRAKVEAAEAERHAVGAGFGEAIRLVRKALDDVGTDANVRAFLDRTKPLNVVRFEPETPSARQLAAPPKDKPPTAEKAPPGPPGGGALAMLDTLAICYPWAIPASLWGTFSGRSPISGPWHKAIAELKAAEFIIAGEGKFSATVAGVEASKEHPAHIGSDLELWHRWRDVIRGQLGTAAVEMLELLADYRPAALTAKQWALLLSRSPISGPWHGALKVLTKWDCIEKVDDRFAVTDKGTQIVDAVGGRDASAALTSARIGRLSTAARQIYDILPGERADLAKRLGKSPISGPWHAAIKELTSSGLAEERDKLISRVDEVL